MIFVKKIINDWDPIELLSHAPDDEYHSEIEEIQQLLQFTEDADKLADGIHNVFYKAFGREAFNKNKKECKQIAQLLLDQSTYQVQNRTGDKRAGTNQGTVPGRTGDGSMIE